MGCCFSQPDGPNSPYADGAASSSARAINTAQQTASARPTAEAQDTDQQPSGSRRQRDRDPLDRHLNKPLKRHKWTSKDRTWTRRALDEERAAFFDTRVTGRAEIWQSLHAACQQLWLPPPSDGATDEALATAQTIIDTVEVTVPSGNLAKGAYDQLGNFYALPPYVVSDPTNLQEEDLAEDNDDENNVDGEDFAVAEEGVKGELSGTTGEDTDDPKAEERREEKGKAVVSEQDLITIRARVSENGRDYQTTVAKTAKVSQVARGIAQAYGLAKNKKVRIVYMGKVLKDNTSLEAQGWKDGHIVNAMVFDRS